MQNTTSIDRQHRLWLRAVALGFRLDQIIVNDDGLGRSAASAGRRDGSGGWPPTSVWAEPGS